MPGYRDCNSLKASPMVFAFTSTTSSLLVSFRKGVGILTVCAIIYLCICKGRFFGRKQRLKFPQARLDLARVPGVSIYGVKSLESIASDAQDHRIFGRNFSRGNEFPGHTDGYAPSRFGKNTFVLGQQLDSFADLVVRDIFGPAAGFLHDFQGVKTVSGRPDGQ